MATGAIGAIHSGECKSNSSFMNNSENQHLKKNYNDMNVGGVFAYAHSVQGAAYGK